MKNKVTQCDEADLPAHHDPPQVGVGAGPLAKYFDRFIISEAEHPLILGEVLEDSPPVAYHSCKEERKLRQLQTTNKASHKLLERTQKKLEKTIFLTRQRILTGTLWVSAEPLV